MLSFVILIIDLNGFVRSITMSFSVDSQSNNIGSALPYHDDVIKWKPFSVPLGLCAGNSTVTGEFPSQRPVTRSFDMFFDLRLNKRLSKKSWGWWFETPWSSLWRHCNYDNPTGYERYWLALNHNKSQQSEIMCIIVMEIFILAVHPLNYLVYACMYWFRMVRFQTVFRYLNCRYLPRMLDIFHDFFYQGMIGY